MINKTSEKSVNTLYWFTVIDLEVLLFMFVRSLWEAYFRLFISCLSSICTWMFALDHVHYARWLPVFINNLSFLRDKNNLVFDAFLNDFFTVLKSERPFSNIATEQTHEQNSKLVKIDDSAVGILDNEAALLKWAVASPIISQNLQDQEPSNPKEKDILKHHENTKSFEEKFKKDKEAFQNAFLTYGNPFQEEEISLMHMISKAVLSDDATSSVKMAKEIGKRQYDLFVEESLISSASLYDNIKKNNLSLFRHKNSIVTSKSKNKIVNLTSDHQLFANLYVACQSRQGDLENFFSHENHSYPTSLSEYGRLRKCSNKSDF